MWSGTRGGTEEEQKHTESKQLHPFAHIYDLVLPILHRAEKRSDALINVRLQILQVRHRIRRTDKASLLAMQLLIPLGEQIEFAMALPNGIPIALPEFGPGTVDGFDGGRVGYADLVGPDTHERAVAGVKGDHYTVHISFPGMVGEP